MRSRALIVQSDGHINIMVYVSHSKEWSGELWRMAMGIMIGGDMNAHVWELDCCENKNGWRMKESMNDIGLHILNYVWDGFNEENEEKKFTLDDMCV